MRDSEIHTYATTFAAILVGLVVARALHSFAVLILCRDRCRHSATLKLWLTVVVLQQAQWWWGLATFAHLGRSFWMFLVTLVSPIAAYLAVELLSVTVPESLTAERPFNVAEHYHRNARAFLICSAVTIGGTVPQHILLIDIWGRQGSIVDQLNLVRCGAVVMLVVLAVLPPTRLLGDGHRVTWSHFAGAVASLTLLVAFSAIARQAVPTASERTIYMEAD